VLEKGGRHVVFVAAGARASMRDVELGSRDGESVTVTRGVEAGEAVIVSRLPDLADGKRIRLR
jgi:multidrug efflux pump subunit AcrA (membrane-fusion protein)